MTTLDRPCHSSTTLAASVQVRLPPPRDPFRAESREANPTLVIGWTRAPEDPDDLARYRWRIGHQLTFCVWRLLSERLATIAMEQRPVSETVAAGIALYDVCSMLLLYAGSCSPEVYLRTIRPEMADADPAFSGRWAREYEDIPGLLRVIRRTRPTAHVAGLLAAARTNQMVHMAVGKRLVPDGPSLLRQSSRKGEHPVTDRERDTFDAFFLVKRAAVSRSKFAAQIRALAGMVADDLAERPMIGPAATWDRPAGQADLVSGFQRDASKLLRDLLHLPLERPCR